jgi:hypothetical protein
MGGNKDKRKKRCSKSLPETSTDLFSVRIWHYNFCFPDNIHNHLFNFANKHGKHILNF